MSPTISELGHQVTMSKPSPDPARVRDNQRRSRARRKEYLQELESKLQKCERLGVQASLDIQNAARLVSAENVRLRDENKRLIDENLRLTEVVRRSGDDTTMKSTYSTDPTSVTRKAPAEVPECRQHAINSNGAGQVLLLEDRPLTKKLSISLDVNTMPMAVSASTPEIYRQTQNEPRSSVNSRHLAHERSSTSPQQVPRHTPPNVSEEVGLCDDTSSCEYAAHIITSMRADVSVDDVRADLGCGNGAQDWQKCKVNNSKLFVAMDRYTG